MLSLPRRCARQQFRGHRHRSPSRPIRPRKRPDSSFVKTRRGFAHANLVARVGNAHLGASARRPGRRRRVRRPPSRARPVRPLCSRRPARRWRRAVPVAALRQATDGGLLPWLAIPILGPLLVALVALLTGRGRAVAAAPSAAVEDGSAVEEVPRSPSPDVALRLLATLQEEARLIDFVREDIDGYSDAQVGSAVRGIHAALRKALDERLAVEPILRGRGRRPRRGAGRLRAGADPPHRQARRRAAVLGVLRHGGWRARDVRLPAPSPGSDATILRPPRSRSEPNEEHGRASAARQPVRRRHRPRHHQLRARLRRHVRADERGQRRAIRVLAVPQVTAPGTVEPRAAAAVVPLSRRPPDELAGEALRAAVGRAAATARRRRARARARRRGARPRGRRRPSRGCAIRRIDRTAPILPWVPETGVQADDARHGVARLAARASTAYLAHLRDAWNARACRRRRGAAARAQDDLPHRAGVVRRGGARADRARRAPTPGFARVHLLEEPQAAFYAWLDAAGDAWREAAARSATSLLVCDVGGGTTDFSLIAGRRGGRRARARARRGRRPHPARRRQHGPRARLPRARARWRSEGTALDAWQLRGLVLALPRRQGAPARRRRRPTACRSRSSAAARKVIGGTLRAELDARRRRGGAGRRLLPARSPLDAPPAARRAAPGLQELGLPYAADAGDHAPPRRSSSHARRRRRARATADRPMPLFNGGVMQRRGAARPPASTCSALVRRRRRRARVLAGADLDLAVARGAAYYGLARRGRGVRIRGGTARAYYIGVETRDAGGARACAPPIKALCVVPFGMEEGTERRAAGAGVRPGRRRAGRVPLPRLVDARATTRVGTLLDELGRRRARRAGAARRATPRLAPATRAARVPVRLQAHVTEVGTLELWCVSRDGGERWKLEFNVRASGAARLVSDVAATAAGALRRRHRPRHDQLGGRLRRHRGGDAAHRVVRRSPQLVARGRGRRRARRCRRSSTSPASTTCAPGALALPWDATSARYAVGEFARAQGARVPGRLVTSAKSWLCHGGVDRDGRDPAVGRRPRTSRKLSPVEASARYPRSTCARPGTRRIPDAPLGRAGRRAHRAGVVRRGGARADRRRPRRSAGLRARALLEEPQAAFYAWLAAHARGWQRAARRRTRLVLVVDVGGGTTDFSLIAHRGATASASASSASRSATTCCSAATTWTSRSPACVEPQPRASGSTASAGTRSPAVPRRQGALLGDDAAGERRRSACRAAAARVVGGTRERDADARRGRARWCSTASSRSSPRDARPRTARAPGLQEWGLPFAARAGDHAPPGGVPAPARGDRVAGARRRARRRCPTPCCSTAARSRRRLIRARMLRRAAGAVERRRARSSVLESAGLDLAVARGAAYYGLVRRGLGVRIGGGSRARVLPRPGARRGHAGADAVDARLPACRAACTRATRSRSPRPSSRCSPTQPVQLPALHLEHPHSATRPARWCDAAARRWSSCRRSAPCCASAGSSPRARSPVHVRRRRSPRSARSSCGAARCQTDHRWRLQFDLRERGAGSTRPRDGRRRADAPASCAVGAASAGAIAADDRVAAAPCCSAASTAPGRRSRSA